MPDFGMRAGRSTATAPLTGAENPALRSARVGHQAYALMNTNQANTAPELCAALRVSESELYEGIHAYLFVTTGCDLSQGSNERVPAVA